jgi:hypothetical protein
MLVTQQTENKPVHLNPKSYYKCNRNRHEKELPNYKCKLR